MDHKNIDQQSTQALKEISLLAIKEARSARRWRVFFRLVVLIIALGITGTHFFKKYKHEHHKHISVLELSGAISPDNPFNAHDVIETLEQDMKDENNKAIILSLDSPGGSPVQSARIYDSILRLKKEHPKVPVYAIVNDLCASGCYYIASAADKIIIDKSSIVGSIGVIMRGFGMVDLIKKIGVENRTIASAKNKDFLDPFSPINPEHVEIAKDIIKMTYKNFTDDVSFGRKGKIKLKEPGIFSGKVWVGPDAIRIGLADELGTIESVKNKEFKNLKVNYQTTETWAYTFFRKMEFSIADHLLNNKIYMHRT